MLKLDLKRIEIDGIYGDPPIMFDRAKCLYPAAADSLDQLHGHANKKLVVSDVFRSPAESRKAVLEKRGAQPPGYSAHNFGLAIDVAVDRTLEVFGIDYAGLLELMASYGWRCHRQDRARGFEDWHFNFLGTAPATWLPTAPWSAVAEARIQEIYGADLHLTVTEIQLGLAGQSLYAGPIDGIPGQKTRDALEHFAAVWGTGTLIDSVSLQRTLAVITAQR